jgi:hypothetical protein
MAKSPTYVLPQTVDSPKALWRLDRVLVDGGEGHSAYALGYWLDEPDWCPVIGIRWNGSLKRPLGTPSSRQYAVWFVLPDRWYPAVIDEFEKSDDITPALATYCREFLKLSKAKAA